MKASMSIKDITEHYKGTFEVDLKIIHHFSSGVYAKQMSIPKGYTALSHSHVYDHLSILAKGKVIVSTDEETNEYIAPTAITIKAGVNHAIYAVEDSSWFCVHATEETDEDKIDEVLIEKN
jgi:quercetin dioxygenase-like cupin family protein